MKQFVIIVFSLILSANVQAQNKMKVWLNDNTSQTFDMNNISRVTFEYSDEEDIPQEGLYDKGDGTGYLNGHAWVDLGFRAWIGGVQKRVVFATMNIGAESPEDPGYYFRWGELNGWKIETNGNSISTAQQMPCVKDRSSYANGSATTYNSSTFTLSGWMSIYNNQQVVNNGCIQGKTNLYANSTVYGDAATYNWGEGWVTMTSDDLYKYLFGNTNIFDSSPRTFGCGNVVRYAVKTPNAGAVWEGNGQKLFLPLCGYAEGGNRFGGIGDYWTSTPRTTVRSRPYYLEFSDRIIDNTSMSLNSYDGLCIRPIAFIDM